MKIAVFGSGGRIGRRVCVLARERGHLVLPFEAADVKEERADVVIDFSLPQATEEVCRYCLLHRCPLVSGVTGRTLQQQKLVEDLSESVPVQAKSNFSRGIAAMRQVCRLLASLNWDCEIVETHRKGKQDAPSGTAKTLGCDVMRNGTRKVTFHSLRCGSNLGRHEVVFATQGESITVIHQAENADIFALGAILCAEELFEKLCKNGTAPKR